ncbi:MAG TPA: hypothetical protein VF810_04135 [Patescibacteria group bacterium]
MGKGAEANKDAALKNILKKLVSRIQLIHKENLEGSFYKVF